jgi:hypothetical protein
MKFLDKFRKEKSTVVITNIQYVTNVYILPPGGKVVNKDDHSTNYGARVQGSVSVTGNMENSLNTINHFSDNGAQPNLKARLKELHAVIKQLIPELSKDEAETVSRDLKSLTDEVTSSRPRKSMFEVTAAGLVDAAKTVASMTEPVTKAVKAVTDLFSSP